MAEEQLNVHPLLKEIVVEARQMLLEMSRDFSDEDARVIFPGCRPLAWHYGHCVLSQQNFLSGKGWESTLSGDYQRLFHAHAVPSETMLFYPDLAALRKDMERVYISLIQFLTRYFHPGRPRPEDEDRKFVQDAMQGVIRMVSHEWYHIGQVAILRELIKKPPVETP